MPIRFVLLFVCLLYVVCILSMFCLASLFLNCLLVPAPPCDVVAAPSAAVVVDFVNVVIVVIVPEVKMTSICKIYVLV